MTAAELLAEIERREVCVYRDGRHYVPLFVPSKGWATVDERAAALSALRGVEAAREALADAAHALRLTHQLGAPMSACDEVADRCCEVILALSEVTP